MPVTIQLWPHLSWQNVQRQEYIQQAFALVVCIVACHATVTDQQQGRETLQCGLTTQAEPATSRGSAHMETNVIADV